LGLSGKKKSAKAMMRDGRAHTATKSCHDSHRNKGNVNFRGIIAHAIAVKTRHKTMKKLWQQRKVKILYIAR